MSPEHLAVICLFMFSVGYMVECVVADKTRVKSKRIAEEAEALDRERRAKSNSSPGSTGR